MESSSDSLYIGANISLFSEPALRRALHLQDKANWLQK